MDDVRTLISTLHRSITLLLPFTDPSKPLVQDVAHTIALCAILYYAPHFLERYRVYQQRLHHVHPPVVTTPATPTETPGMEAMEGPGAPQHQVHDPLPANPTNQPPAAPLEPLDDDAPPLLVPAGPEPDSDPEDGPAARPIRAPRQTVGAKKAKSLARRDQRRAYHEFQRSRGEAQRAADAAGAAEREAALAAERSRRAAVEAELEERTRREREEKRTREEEERREETRVRGEVVRVVGEGLERRGCVDLGDVARGVGRERGWVEKLVRVSGLVGGRKEDGVVAMVTGRGWVVRVDEGIMRESYRIALEDDHQRKLKVTFEELGSIIEGVVVARATTGKRAG
ncbi:hypothetical protein W97_01519 [Coniosporium apollinis CBS 100218]|uniref:Uncharacterized protein n=1 Tax=Coniosporium apollinis (strain CBS 100218) TaxID=1168221 RepID=R7YK90_CONA1|nr:uncharacterized protein W97_01519 [Coniosporium apollinis CBS 100218]EON62298.1 hypothetical protein W97_01519 [Coniosporium apollinis CBS 100218]